MPRNAAGTYTLPDPPRVPNTTIDSPDENITRDDIGAELTNSLDRNGRGGMLAPFRIADGTVAAPGLGFLNDPDNGLYRIGGDDWALACQGVKVMEIIPGSITITAPNLNISNALNFLVSASLQQVNFYTNTDAELVHRNGVGDFNIYGASVVAGLRIQHVPGATDWFVVQGGTLGNGARIGTTLGALRVFSPLVFELGATIIGPVVMNGALSGLTSISYLAPSATTQQLNFNTTTDAEIVHRNGIGDLNLYAAGTVAGLRIKNRPAAGIWVEIIGGTGPTAPQINAQVGTLHINSPLLVSQGLTVNGSGAVIETVGANTPLIARKIGIAQLIIGNGGASTNFIDADTTTFRNGAGAVVGMQINGITGVTNIFAGGMRIDVTGGNTPLIAGKAATAQLIIGNGGTSNNFMDADAQNFRSAAGVTRFVVGPSVDVLTAQMNFYPNTTLELVQRHAFGMDFYVNLGGVLAFRLFTNGQVRIPWLAGAGTRPVLADATGILSAP